MVTLTVTAGRNRDLGTVTPVAAGKSRAAVTVAFLVRGHGAYGAARGRSGLPGVGPGPGGTYPLLRVK
jgi:hypothetical protein